MFLYPSTKKAVPFKNTKTDYSKLNIRSYTKPPFGLRLHLKEEIRARKRKDCRKRMLDGVGEVNENVHV